MSINFPSSGSPPFFYESPHPSEESSDDDLSSTCPLSPSMIEEEPGDPFTEPPAKWIRSAEGILSTRHLRYYLEKNPPENLNEVILWSFTQRKFPSEPLTTDTFYRPKDVHPIAGKIDSPVINKEGFAVSDSEHQPWTTEYIPDQYVRKIDRCKSFKIHSGLYIGYYGDGKCIIQQPGARGCAFTCIAMLLHDKQVDYDLSTLMRANVTSPDQFSREIRKYGYQTKSLTGEELLESTESVFVNTRTNQSMSHTMIIDAADKHKLTIRDPFHGWRITVLTSDFYSLIQEAKFLALLKMS